jgi:protein-S-isoprenylcysteine O-methyltransferase Ste14
MTNESVSPPAMHPLDNKIPPPIVIVFVGAAMWLLTLFEPALPLTRPVRGIVASLLLGIGVFVLASGFFAFRRSRTTIDPVQIHRASALVTHGIFRFTRNPMYVGFTTLLTGWAVLLSVPLALFGPVAFVLFTTRFQIIPEERAMLAKFGQAYSRYQSSVRRWI